MTPAIPVNSLLSSVPSVLGTGGNPLSPNGLILTSDQSIPYGTVASFPSATAVSNWFGPNANITKMAGIYFSGYTLAESLPNVLFVAQLNPAAIAG